MNFPLHIDVFCLSCSNIFPDSMHPTFMASNMKSPFSGIFGLGTVASKHPRRGKQWRWKLSSAEQK
jgi:hypothetical protein